MSVDPDVQKEAERAFHVYLAARAAGEQTDTQEFIAAHQEAVREPLARLLSDYHTLVGGSEEEGEPGPRQLGEFRLIRQLGQGASGAVWEAVQGTVQRRVALKILRPHFLLSGRAQERFEREAIAGGRLQHPNIVAVYAAGKVDDTQYIVQELIPSGRSLADWIAQQDPRAEPDGVRLRKLVGWFLGVARGAQCAHEAGVIHRDIKPSNILLDGERRALLADFGLATLQGDESQSVSGEFVGTPVYASPEQVMGRKVGLDARSDVFSLGASLYECLTLRRPFPGSNRSEVVEAILVRDPVPPRALQPRLPADLCAIVEKALQKNRGDRYASMEAMAEDLGRWLDGRPVLARPLGRLRRAWRWCGRRPVLSGSIAAALLAIVAFTTLVLWFRTEASRRAEESQALHDRTEYLRRVGRANEELAVGRVITAREYLEGCVEACRAWEWWQLLRSSDSSIEALSWSAAATPHALAVHPDGRLAVSSSDGVHVFEEGRPRRLEIAGGAVQSLSFSPAGGTLAGLSDHGELQLWSTESWEARGIPTESAPQRPRSMAFLDEGRLILAGPGRLSVRASTDGRELGGWVAPEGVVCLDVDRGRRRVVSASWNGEIVVWDESGQPLQRYRERGGAPIQDVVFMPDGGVLSLDANGAVHLWEGGRPTPSREWSQPDATSMDRSPGGGLVAFSNGDGSIAVMDTGSSALLASLRGHEKSAQVVRFSPSGLSLVSASFDGSLRRWNGAAPRRVTPGPRGGGGAWFDPAGRRVLTAIHHRMRLRDAERGELIRPLWGSEESVDTALLREDGSAVSVTRRRMLSWWDAAGRRVAQRQLDERVFDDGDPVRGVRRLLALDGEAVAVLGPAGHLERVDPGGARTLREAVRAMDADPAGRLYWAAGQDDGGLVLERHASGRVERLATVSEEISALAVDAAGARLAYATSSGGLRIRDLRSGTTRSVSRAPWRDAVGSLDFHPTEPRLVAYVRNERRVVLIELDQLEPLWTAEVPIHVSSIEFSRDGTMLLGQSDDFCSPVRWVNTAPEEAGDFLRALDRLGRAERRAEELLREHGHSGDAQAAFLARPGSDWAPFVERALAALGHDPQVLSRHAWAALSHPEDVGEELAQALRKAELAHEAAPWLPGVGTVLGQALLIQGDPGRAVEVLGRAPEPGPSDHPAWGDHRILEILALHASGRTREAQELWADPSSRQGARVPRLQKQVEALFPEERRE